MRAKSKSCSSRVIGKIWDIGRHGVVCRGRVWLQLRKQLRHRPWSSTYTQVHRELLYTITITIVRRLLDRFIENIPRLHTPPVRTGDILVSIYKGGSVQDNKKKKLRPGAWTYEKRPCLRRAVRPATLYELIKSVLPCSIVILEKELWTYEACAILF